MQDSAPGFGGIHSPEDGKVYVHKTEKPTQHGAWTGVGVEQLDADARALEKELEKAERESN